MSNVFGDSGLGATTNVLGNAVTTSTGNQSPTVVLVKDYGAVGDGITDATSAVREAHVYANANNYTVSYDGISVLALQANAQIPINTNVDFANCKILLLNGVTGGPSYSGNILYTVVDPQCPLTTVTNVTPTTASDNLKKGSSFPTIGIFDGTGFVNITHSSITVPGRGTSGVPISSTVNYTQTFYVHRGAEVTHALAADLTANSGLLSSVSYRRASARRVVISNFSIYENGFDSQRLFYVTRNNVDFRHATVLEFAGSYSGASYNNINQLIRIDNCGDVTITDYKLQPRMITGGAGSYGLTCYNTADIYVDRMTSIGKPSDAGKAWGTIQNENVNGFHISNSVINRVDAHAGGFNFFVHDCIVHGDDSNSAVQYGWGGGTLSVKDTKVYNATSIVFKRTDYSGSWYGDVVVADCIISNRIFPAIYGVRLENLGGTIEVFAPENISITNVSRTDRSGSDNGGTFFPLALTVRETSTYMTGSAKVYAPHNIRVHNVQVPFQCRIAVNVDLMNMWRLNTSHTLNISICELRPDLVANGANTCGFYDYAKHAGRTGITTTDYPVRLMMHIKDCSRFYVKTAMGNSASSVREVHVENCGLTGLELNTAESNKLMCRVQNCRFNDIPTSGGSLVIGSATSSNSRYTAIFDTSFSNAATWDLSNVSVLKGCLFQGTSVTLPATASLQSAFTGWYSTSVVANGFRVIDNFSSLAANYNLTWPATDGVRSLVLSKSPAANTLAWSSSSVQVYTVNTPYVQYAGANNQEEIMANILIPGGSVGPNGVIRINFLMTNPDTSASLKQMRLRIGATPLTSPNGSTTYNGTTHPQTYTTNMGSNPTFNLFTSFPFYGNNNTTQLKYVGSASTGTGAGVSLVAVDTTNDFYICLTAQTFDIVNALHTLHRATAEVVYGA